MAQHVHVSYDHEEGEQREDDEVFHRLGIGVAVVLIFRLAEDERFVGIAERLGYHGHNHGYLACGAVDAELGVGIGGGVYLGEENLVGSLVEYAGDTEHEDGPAVAHHAAEEGLVEAVFLAEELFPEEEGERSGAEQIDVEGIAGTHRGTVYGGDEARAASAVADIGQDEEEHEVEGYRHEDVEQLEGGELHGALLVAQIGEGDALEGVYSHGDGHHPHV